MRTSKDKRKFKYPVFLGVGVFVVLLIFLALLNGQTQDTESADTDDVLTSITNEELADFLQKEQSGFLYVGRPTCPVCREFKPLLEGASEETGQNVYYYNTDAGREQDEAKTGELLDQLEVEYVPILFYIENGKIVDRLTPETMDQAVITAFIESHMKKL